MAVFVEFFTQLRRSFSGGRILGVDVEKRQGEQVGDFIRDVL